VRESGNYSIGSEKISSAGGRTTGNFVLNCSDELLEIPQGRNLIVTRDNQGEITETASLLLPTRMAATG
jgi:hypothetical protein